MNKVLLSVKLCVWFLRYSYWETLRLKNSFLEEVRGWKKYFADVFTYLTLDRNNGANFSVKYMRPRFTDATETTCVDATCFYQNAWCARKVFQTAPKRHYDIGSEAGLIGILSQFVPVTMIDIRPVDLPIKGLHFERGDITKLPFADKSIFSLSCMCVIEHIGLGRYGDPLDSFGSEKAAKELTRVLARGGSLCLSVPIASVNRIYFNAHRAFTREYLLELFSPLKLVEEQYIYKRKIYKSYDKKRGFGTGLYHFKK